MKNMNTIFDAAQALVEANHAAAQGLLEEAEAGSEDFASQVAKFHALVEVFILGNKILKILGDYARNEEATHEV